MLAIIPSAAVTGVQGSPVSVEVHVANGLPGYTVVGLPDAAARESRDRVRAAFVSSDLTWPLRRITVNLAPSGVRKGGSGLDLPIAVGVLVASGALAPAAVEGLAFVGELGLDGSLRGVPGTLVLAEAVDAPGLVVADADAAEASLAPGPRSAGGVRSAPSLRVLVDRLTGTAPWTPPGHPPVPGARPGSPRRDPLPVPDLADVRGQPFAARALEVAAAGGHHLLMVGPPGAGKTMLAARLPGLLPDLAADEALEVTRVHSVAGEPLPPEGLVRRPPFRAPHHGSSAVALVGGGTAALRPGEVSLASGGVLFLDELGEFPAVVLDALRQPLEEGVVRISRARGSATLPARFLLVGAMNPCPCGEGGLPGACRCSDAARRRYARRLSAPLLDRFDLAVRVPRPPTDAVLPAWTAGRSASADTPCRTVRGAEPTAVVASRVAAARERAAGRGYPGNARIPGRLLDDLAPMGGDGIALIAREVRAGRLSPRGVHRVHRLALTLADLGEHRGPLGDVHVHEALVLRGQRGDLVGVAA